MHYSDALHLGLPLLCRQIARWGSDCEGLISLGRHTLLLLEAWFTRIPFLVGVILWVSSFVGFRSPRCDWVVTSVSSVWIGALQGGMIHLSDVCEREGLWAL